MTTKENTKKKKKRPKIRPDAESNHVRCLLVQPL